MLFDGRVISIIYFARSMNKSIRYLTGRKFCYANGHFVYAKPLIPDLLPNPFSGLTFPIYENGHADSLNSDHSLFTRRQQ